MPSKPYKLADAIRAVDERLSPNGPQSTIHGNIEREHWWYIPPGCVTIGYAGAIVDKADLFVSLLSTSLSLEDSFWGHDHGIVADLVDLTVYEVEDVTVLTSIFRHMRRQVTSRYEAPRKVVVPYLEPEIAPAIRDSFPTFRNHFVWHAIPEIRKFHEAGKLSFSCARSPTNGDS